MNDTIVKKWVVMIEDQYFSKDLELTYNIENALIFKGKSKAKQFVAMLKRYRAIKLKIIQLNDV